MYIGYKTHRTIREIWDNAVINGSLIPGTCDMNSEYYMCNMTPEERKEYGEIGRDAFMEKVKLKNRARIREEEEHRKIIEKKIKILRSRLTQEEILENMRNDDNWHRKALDEIVL